MSEPIDGSGRDPNRNSRDGTFKSGNRARTEVMAQRQRGMAKWIAKNTSSGIELAAAALEIARDASHRDRLKAIDWLTVRMCGKVPDKIEVSDADGRPLNPLAGLTAEQLLSLAKGETK